MEEDKIDRSKEYEILGRILVNFEKVINALRLKIYEQMLYLGLDEEKGQRPIDILLAKLDACQLCEKFRAISIEIFGIDSLSTKQVKILSDCMKELIEIRNLLLHSTWFIGYSEFSGSEEEISRGFNDRYGKKGLIRNRIYFSEEELKKINESMDILIDFILKLRVDNNEKDIATNEEPYEENLRKILLSLKKYKSTIEII